VFEDEAGQGLRPPKGRTWGRRGHPPVVKVGGRGSGRVSIAGLICTRPGRAPRLIYRVLAYHARKDEAKGFAEKAYARLLDAAHAQLGGPIVLVWDNLGTHVSAAMKELIAARPWLTVFQLPSYAPELNPVEGLWAHLKKSLVNFVRRTVDQLVVLVKNRLKRMQYRPVLLQGFIAKSGIDLEPP
jgi:putative transposase